MNALPVILIAVVLVISGQLLLKVGMRSVGEIDGSRLRSPLRLILRIATRPALSAGFTLYAASAILWLYVLSRSELSFAYPFLSLAYAGVTAAATVVLKERFSGRQWAGLCLLAAGVVAVAASGA